MCNVSFTGHRKKIGSVQGTNVNFIRFIGLLAKYVPIIEK
jgi:hypothetical protein